MRVADVMRFPRLWRVPRKPRSIATRLFLSAIMCSVLLLIVADVALSHIYRGNNEQSFDQRLDVYLRALVADLAVPPDDTRRDGMQLSEPQFELTLSGWYWQITRLDTPNPRIKSSRSLFASELPRLEKLGVSSNPGQARRGSAVGPDGRPIRLVEREIDLGDGGLFLVQVAATTEEIEARILQFEMTLSATFAALALALAGTTALQVRYGLRPLRRLQEAVATIRQGESERIEGLYSRDLSPLAGEVNLLIASNRDILERARTQVGNLAHALKTPLSVITNEARADESALAGKVIEQAAVMRDQVTWYLDRARAAARVGAVHAATEIGPVVSGLVRTFEKIYDERGLEFSADLAQGLRFRGERQDLEDMIGNLVDNAGKWAASKVAICVSSQEAAQPVERPMFAVIIDDDGPGLAQPSRDQALARGRRLDESKPGSGLGLSIAADLATLYGGFIVLEDSPLGGLRTRLGLPSIGVRAEAGA